MPFKDPSAQRKLMADRRAQAKRDNEKDNENASKAPQNPVIPAKSVIPAVIPTMSDVESGKAWQVLAGPFKGELRWHRKLAQSWKNVPCNIVDGVCVADHGPDYHPHIEDTAPEGNPMSAFISRPSNSSMSNLGKLQAVAGALGKLGKEVRFGLDGPTITELAATIGQAPPAYPHPGKHS